MIDQTHRPAARKGFRHMMATETGDPQWLQSPDWEVDIHMDREFGHLTWDDGFFAAVAAQTAQWVPTTDED